MISEMFDNVGLISSIKNVIELETTFCMKDVKFKLLSRSVSSFSVNKEMIKQKERRFLKVETPFEMKYQAWA